MYTLNVEIKSSKFLPKDKYLKLSGKEACISL